MLKLHFKGTVGGLADASALLTRVGDAAIVTRGRPRLWVMTCPCGCGEQVPVNLDRRAGQAWRLYATDKYGMSLFPSVWRTSGCASHFVIWNDRIWLLGHTEGSFQSETTSDVGVPTADAVLDLLPRTSFAHFSAVAEQLNIVPWNVLAVCRKLVRSNRATEGSGKQNGYFRRL